MKRSSPLPLAGEVGARSAPGEGGVGQSERLHNLKHHPHPPSAPSPASGRRESNAFALRISGTGD